MTKERSYKIWARLVMLFFCLYLAPTDSWAAEEGFFIQQNTDHSLMVQAVPITVFTVQDKIIYPGSEGYGQFVVKNRSDKLFANYELLVLRQSDLGNPSPLSVELKSAKSSWQLRKLEEELSVKRTILPGEKQVYKIVWQWDQNHQLNQSITETALKRQLYEHIQFKLKVEGAEEKPPPLPKTGERQTGVAFLGGLVIISGLVIWYQRRSQLE